MLFFKKLKNKLDGTDFNYVIQEINCLRKEINKLKYGNLPSLPPLIEKEQCDCCTNLFLKKEIKKFKLTEGEIGNYGLYKICEKCLKENYE